MKKILLEINNRTIQIHDSGEGNKGTILGIHGLTGNSLQLSFYEQYYNKDFRFITMDLYGRGNSKANGDFNDIFQHAKDVQAIIEKLDLENIILMGYSMGGFIASIVASESNKVKSLILLDGAATMSEYQRPIVEPSLGRLSKHFNSAEEYIDEVAEGYKTFGIDKSNEIEQVLAYEIEDKGEYWENKASEIIVRQDWESFWEFSPKEVGPKITQPVLLVQASGEIGSNPPLFLPEHYEETISFYPDIEVVVSDSNHYTMVFQKREDIIRYINQFLEKINTKGGKNDE